MWATPATRCFFPPAERVPVLGSPVQNRGLSGRAMNTSAGFRGIWLSVVLLSFAGCGGNNPATPTQTTAPPPPPPPTTTEVLYAANSSNSLFSFKIDQSSGALTQAGSVTPGGETVSNSAIAITPAGSFLYAANDTVSGINAYSTDSSGDLSLVVGSPFPILPLLQPPSAVVLALAIDPKGKFLYASTGAGLAGVASFSINASTGALTGTGGPFTIGIGLLPPGIAIDPTSSFLYATDQEQNIWGFTIDSQSGVLTSISGSPFLAAADNSQPFGVQVDPSGKFLYAALSNAGSIAGFAIDGSSGALSPVPGSPFPTASTQFTQTYALTIHPSGQFLYAFNFNGNTIAAFRIDSGTGALSPISGSPFAVNPNGEGDLIVDPSGKYLYLTIGSGPPSAFVIFDVDPTTGALTPNAQSPVAGSQDPSGLAVAQFQ